MSASHERESDAGELSRLARIAAKEGKVIEAGWLGLCAEVLDPEMAATEMMQMRMAFFAGAQHLFVCIMSLFRDSSEGAIEEGGHRLVAIDHELRAFIDQIKAQGAMADGS